MGRPNDDNALYWRSIRQYKVGLIRHALQQTDGKIKAAAVYLGISEGGLRKEIDRLKADGYYVRDSDQQMAAFEASQRPADAPPEETTPDGEEPEDSDAQVEH